MQRLARKAIARSAQRARRPGRRRSSRSTPPTATSRRWPSPRATSSRSTTSPPTATASRARRSRRSCSPTRSRAGSTRTAPTTTRTRSRRAGCRAIPTYEVKTFERRRRTARSTSCRRRSNPTTPSTRSSPPTSARTRSPRWPTRWASRPTCDSYPAEALGGLTLGVTPLEMANVYATLADGGWRNTPIAITKVVFPDGHVDTNWGKPHRVKVLSEGGHRRGDEHPPPERAERHGGALGDQLPDGRQDGHDQRTGRRLARRLHARTTRRSCGWATRTSACR